MAAYFLLFYVLIVLGPSHYPASQVKVAGIRRIKAFGSSRTVSS